jgi:hypothetical protein
VGFHVTNLQWYIYFIIIITFSLCLMNHVSNFVLFDFDFSSPNMVSCNNIILNVLFRLLESRKFLSLIYQWREMTNNIHFLHISLSLSLSLSLLLLLFGEEGGRSFPPSLFSLVSRVFFFYCLFPFLYNLGARFASVQPFSSTHVPHQPTLRCLPLLLGYFAPPPILQF